MIVAYTDGSCRGVGGGPGGWAFHAHNTETNEKEMVAEGLEWTTNNQAELWAIYHLIMHVDAGSNVVIFTDSRNVIGWLHRNWHRRQDHINNLCLAIEEAKKIKNVKWAFRKVKGHDGEVMNERVDRAAYNAATQILRQQ